MICNYLTLARTAQKCGLRKVLKNSREDPVVPQGLALHLDLADLWGHQVPGCLVDHVVPDVQVHRVAPEKGFILLFRKLTVVVMKVFLNNSQRK